MAGGQYGRHWGLTNHARDDVLINELNGKLNDNLDTDPKTFFNYFKKQQGKILKLYSLVSAEVDSYVLHPQMI